MNGTTENVTHQNDDIVTPTPVWLKILVVGLGVAIIVMLGLILYKIISGVSNMSDDGQLPIELSAVPPVALAALPGGNFNIARPKGMELVAMVPADGEVFLHFRGKNGDDKVIIFNRLTGDVTSLEIAVPGN